ncbi:MAG: hypothetical protein AAFW95_10900 [Cyanobacteria bacterium J06638_6]
MTKTVQDRVKTDWEKAQKEGSQRAERIRKIVQSAATEAFGEIKGGSSEFETIGRKSLAEMIEQLKAKEAAEAAAEASEADGATPEAEAPTWAEIFADLRHLANDRKVDWAQQALTTLQSQIDRFDADMATDYGDRYRLVRPLVRGVRSVVALLYSKLSQPAEPAAATPVQIEVLDDRPDDGVADA